MQTCNYTQFSLQVAVWILVMKYSFYVATSRETKPRRTPQYVLYVRGSLSFSFSASFFYCQACFVDCFSSACCPFYLSVCSLSFSLGTVWLVRPVIELPLFDQGSNRNCTLLTQLCRYACVCAYISGRWMSLCVVMYIMYGCLQRVCARLIRVSRPSVWSKHDIRLYCMLNKCFSSLPRMTTNFLHVLLKALTSKHDLPLLQLFPKCMLTHTQTYSKPHCNISFSHMLSLACPLTLSVTFSLSFLCC